MHDLHLPSASDFSNPPDTADQGGFRTFPQYKKSAKIPRTSVVRDFPGTPAHGVHELSLRLGVLHGERHWVRLLLLVAPGRVVRAGALLFLVSPLTQWSRSYRRCGLSTVSSTPVSLRTLEESPCLCGLLVLFAHGVWVWVLPVDYMDFREMLRAQFLVRQWIHALRRLRELFDEFHTFSMMRWTRILQCCLRSHAERRSLLSSCFSLQSFSRCSHMEIWTSFPRRRAVSFVSSSRVFRWVPSRFGTVRDSAALGGLSASTADGRTVGESALVRRVEGALSAAVCRAAGHTWAMRVHDTGWSDFAGPGRYTNTGHS